MENIHKVGAIGVPGFDWEFQIVDDQSNPVPQGTPGELIIKGPRVMQEYYKNLEATAAVIMNGCSPVMWPGRTKRALSGWWIGEKM